MTGAIDTRPERSPEASAQGSPGPAGPRAAALLACPPVFSYHEAIRSEFSRLGYAVTWWNDRGSESSFYKAGLRLLPGWFAARSTATFMDRLRRLDGTAIEHALIVKGEGMSVDFIRELRRALPRARLSLYFWDSVDNAPRARLIAPLFDSVATFDPVDAKSLGWNYRPLFAREESIAPPTDTEAPRYDWCFIGTLHSDRFRVIERMRKAHPTLRSYFYGYAPSRLLLAARHLADPELWKLPRESVSARMLPAHQVAKIARASRAMLDIEHPRQRGLTMRTIETLLSSRKLITTNRHILESDLYHPSRVHVISRLAPEVPQPFFEQPFEPIATEVRERYSLRRWLLDLTEPAASKTLMTGRSAAAGT